MFEERLRMQKFHLKQVLQESQSLLKVYTKAYASNADEVMNENNISTKSELIVSVLEAMNLQSSNSFGMSLDTYVTITFENCTNSTNIKKGTSNPVWNEDLVL